MWNYFSPLNPNRVFTLMRHPAPHFTLALTLDLNIWHDGTVWQSKLYYKRFKLEGEMLSRMTRQNQCPRVRVARVRGEVVPHTHIYT